MVTVITGEINSGKTTKMREIYNIIKRGDGFILKKLFSNGVYIGQRIIRLSTGEEKDFSYKQGYIPESWDEKCEYDVYSFSKKGFEFAQKVVLETLSSGAGPVFIDEIGPLELRESGFYNILMLVLKAKREVYVTVRKNCLDQVLKEFEIKKYRLIKI